MAEYDDNELFRIAERIRRHTTMIDVITVCDALIVRLGKPIPVPGTVSTGQNEQCPVCAKRRAAETAKKQRQRGKS